MQPFDWSLVHVVTSRSLRLLQHSTGFQCTRKTVFKTVLLDWKCLKGTVSGYLSELCVPVASALGLQHHRSPFTGLLQVPRARTMIGQRSFTVTGLSVEQSSGCSTETGDDTARFEATTRGLSVPHLMCRWTGETSTTGLHYCGVFHDSGAGYKTVDLLT